MARIEVRPLTKADVGAAAELLAARHRRDRERLPFAPARFAAVEACARLLEHALATPGTSAAFGVRAGEPVGYLLGHEQLWAPDSFLAYFFEPSSIMVPNHGHAVRAGTPARDVYRTLYAALADDWVARGFFGHLVYLPAGDPETSEAWAWLGFGHAFVTAVRDTEPLAGTSRPDLAIVRVGSEAFDDVWRLSEELRAAQTRAPMFHPKAPSTDPGWREALRAQLADDGNAAFVASRAGRALGMQTFVAPKSMLSPLQTTDRMRYLFEGVVLPEARGAGVAHSLLRHALGWARGEGYTHCALHFLSTNPTGGPFWLATGFAPTELGLERRIDPRIAWARA